MNIQLLISIPFLLAGFFFFLAATVGLLRFPDFFCRLHATGKGDTLAILFSLVGLSIYEGFSLASLKIIFIAVFMFLAQPTSTHAIARAAMRCGLEPWHKGDKERR
jgi:multicomponent Na+:H+ antiporter subunit G